MHDSHENLRRALQASLRLFSSVHDSQELTWQLIVNKKPNALDPWEKEMEGTQCFLTH